MKKLDFNEKENGMNRGFCITFIIGLVFIFFIGLSAQGHAGWFDNIKSDLGLGDKEKAAPTEPVKKEIVVEKEALTGLEMSGGIKDALAQAVQVSVSQLGKKMGLC